MINNGSPHSSKRQGYTELRAPERGRVRARLNACMHACMWGCSIINHTAEVSDVQSITEIHQQPHVQHTGNLNEHECTDLLFTQISHIQSHLGELIAQPGPCFSLVFTSRGVGETGGGGGRKAISITMRVEHEMMPRRQIAAANQPRLGLEGARRINMSTFAHRARLPAGFFHENPCARARTPSPHSLLSPPAGRQRPRKVWPGDSARAIRRTDARRAERGRRRKKQRAEGGYIVLEEVEGGRGGILLVPGELSLQPPTLPQALWSWT